MAIEQLTTISGLQEAADVGQETIMLLNEKLMEATGEGRIIDACIAKLEAYISAIERQENALLNKFGVSSEAELQAKFQDFYNSSGLIRLTGSDLDRAILEAYRQGLKGDLKELQQYINKYIKPAMLEATAKEVGNNKEVLAKAFNDILNGWTIELNLNTGSAKVSSAKPVSASNFSDEWDILASKLTSAQERRIRQLMRTAPNGLNNTNTTVSSNIGNLTSTTTIELDWYEATEHLTPSQAKQLPPHKLQQMQDNVTNLILSRVNPGYRDIIRSYINRMLYIDPTMYFVGKNVNDITGIVGEISAIVAITELMPGVDRHKIIDWVGNHKINNRKVSIDVILKGIGGVQIKNTSIDTERIPIINIDFAEGNVHTILQNLSTQSIDLMDLEVIFESEAFNVPAKMRGTRMVEVGINSSHAHGDSNWGDFVVAYNCMQNVIRWTHQLMSAYAPDFLYMSGGSTFENQLANLDRVLDRSYRDIYTDTLGRSGNILYIVAGRPQLMSTTLKNIQENLRNLNYIKGKATNFSLQSSLGTYLEGKKKIPYNFVAYSNLHHSIDDLKQRKVKLTSSMNFPSK